MYAVSFKAVSPAHISPVIAHYTAKILDGTLGECTKKLLVKRNKVQRFIEIMVQERMDVW